MEKVPPNSITSQGECSKGEKTRASVLRTDWTLGQVDFKSLMLQCDSVNQHPYNKRIHLETPTKTKPNTQNGSLHLNPCKPSCDHPQSCPLELTSKAPILWNYGPHKWYKLVSMMTGGGKGTLLAFLRNQILTILQSSHVWLLAAQPKTTSPPTKVVEMWGIEPKLCRVPHLDMSLRGACLGFCTVRDNLRAQQLIVWTVKRWVLGNSCWSTL